MRKIIFLITTLKALPFVLTILLFLPLQFSAPGQSVWAGELADDSTVKDETQVITGTPPAGFGGGSPGTVMNLEELTEDQRKAIQERIRKNIEMLRAEGRLDEPMIYEPVLFGWPLRLAPGLDDPDYHAISGFVDHDPAYPGYLLDYECGDRTYDTENGYNHRGTDPFTWPFWWLKMDNDEVEVIAAAPGQIVSQEDGNYDRNCGWGAKSANKIHVRHADGSVAWYGHMKNGSLTTKQVGDRVVEGEYLGVVGSSGNSTAPHLHFEIHDAYDNLIDPYTGPCNSLNPESWWKDQRPYYDSSVNKVSAGDAPPVFPECPNPENPNTRVTFNPGSTVYFTTYYRDQLSSQVSHYTIYRPNDTIYSQWDHNIPDPHYSHSYWYWYFTIPPGEPIGIWKFEVLFEGQTYVRQFTIGPPDASGRVPQYTVQGDLLQLDKVGGDELHLTWGVSCIQSDADFAIYEGSIGDFTSHVRIMCSTGGATETNLIPNSGDRYFLVAPRNNDREGSLGKDSDGTLRPEGLLVCAERLVLDCP
jgi:hypothetical protein